MLWFLVKRLVWMAITLWVVFTLTWFLMRAVPGGPFDAEKKIPEEIKRNIEARYKLDQPLHVQYLDNLSHVVRFDFGPSYKLLDYDVNKARDLLAQAGYPNGEGFPVIRLLVNRNEQQRIVAQSIATMWRTALNIQTEILLRDWEAFETASKTGDCDAAASADKLDGPAPYWQSYRYDVIGNRTSLTQHQPGGDVTTTYRVDASHPHALGSATSAKPALESTSAAWGMPDATDWSAKAW